jgi:hypothetical protein
VTDMRPTGGSCGPSPYPASPESRPFTRGLRKSSGSLGEINCDPRRLTMRWHKWVLPIAGSTGSALCSRKRDGIYVIQSSAMLCYRRCLPTRREEIMANVSKLIFGAAIAAARIATPALAQYASQSDPSIFITGNISE